MEREGINKWQELRQNCGRCCTALHKRVPIETLFGAEREEDRGKGQEVEENLRNNTNLDEGTGAEAQETWTMIDDASEWEGDADQGE